MSKTKIGIFSGTFDPIHIGHVEFALEALHTFQLTQVIFLPEQNPREKSPATYQHRLQMIRLAIANYPQLNVVTLDQPQFSAAITLPLLQKMYTSSQLVLLIGSDIVKTFAYRWPGLEQLLQSMHLAVGLRSNDELIQINKTLSQTYLDYGLQPNYALLPSPWQYLASTKIRIKQHTINDITPEVAQYITQHNLY